MGKTEKKRKRKTKWIQEQLESKRMKQWPEMCDLLKELRICYVIGAKNAVYLLAVQLVERYLEKRYLLGEGELVGYITNSGEIVLQSNDESQIDVQLLRNERSPAFEIWKNGIELLVEWENEWMLKRSQKQVVDLMGRLERLFQFE